MLTESSGGGIRRLDRLPELNGRLAVTIGQLINAMSIANRGNVEMRMYIDANLARS